MSKQELIKNYYFNKKYKQKEIAEKLGVTKQYISKILNNDNRYICEKERRKVESQKKHKQKTINYINKKRKGKSTDLDYQILQHMHIQASHELSTGKRTISNRAFRNWNNSIYEFQLKTNEFRLKEEMRSKVSYAIPKKIKWN